MSIADAISAIKKEPTLIGETPQNFFLHGGCLYFARRLKELCGGEIYYIPKYFHFCTKIGNSYFDVAGKYTPPIEPIPIADVPLKIRNQFRFCI